MAAASKNIKQNKGKVEYCKECGNEIDCVYEASMPVKKNGARAFKVKLIRKCCEG